MFGNDIAKKYNSQEYDICSEPNKTFMCINEYGFIISQFSERTHPYTVSLKDQWYKLIIKYGDNTKKYTKNTKVLELLCAGIPISLKYVLWKTFVHKSFSHDYETLKGIKNEYSHQIHVDIQRTFRSHYLFHKPFGRGQSELFNVLTAFANFMPNIGYCQGMSNLAGILLMYFPEEETFEMLVSIIFKNKLETLFDKSLSKVSSIQKTQNQVFKRLIPNLYSHLINNDVDVNVYGIGWYLTLFTRFDIKYTLRFWDLFLYLDFSVFFFLSTSILNYFSESILNLKNEQLIEFMSKMDTCEIDIDSVISNSMKYKKKYGHIISKLN